MDGKPRLILGLGQALFGRLQVTENRLHNGGMLEVAMGLRFGHLGTTISFRRISPGHLSGIGRISHLGSADA